MKSVTRKLVITEFSTDFCAVFHTFAVKLFFVDPNKPRFGVRYQAFFGTSAICEFGVIKECQQRHCTQQCSV